MQAKRCVCSLKFEQFWIFLWDMRLVKFVRLFMYFYSSLGYIKNFKICRNIVMPKYIDYKLVVILIYFFFCSDFCFASNLL